MLTIAIFSGGRTEKIVRAITDWNTVRKTDTRESSSDISHNPDVNLCRN